MVAFDWSTALRSARAILFVVLYVLVTGWIISLLVRNQDAIEGLLAAPNTARALALKILGTLLSDEHSLSQLLTAHPPLLVFYVHFAVATLPLFTIAGTFDQTASDLGTRHVRFLLLKTDRTAIFLGRFLGAYGWVTLWPVVVMLGWGFFAGDPLYAMRLAVTLAVYALPCTAFMALLASATASPGLALSLGVAWQFVGWIAASFLSFADARYRALAWLFPSVVKDWLLSPALSLWAAGLAVSMGYAALLLAVGWLVFLRRDV